MIVIDASVAVKWFVPESEHDLALSVLGSGQRLVAPELVVSETMHVLRKKIRSGDVREEQFLRAAAELPRDFDDLVPVVRITDEASRLSLKLDHGFYDCVYLALAMTSGAEFLTADEAFVRKIDQAGFRGIARRLGDWKPGGPAKPKVSRQTIESIARLAGRVRETMRFLEEHYAGDRLRLVSSPVFKPAFSSPAYLHLQRLLLALEPEERAEVIALGWLGRAGETGARFPVLLENARRFMDDLAQDIDYLVSVMGTVEAGYSKLLASRDTLTQDEGDR